MDIDDGETSQCFAAGSDICQQILTRYSRSSAVQHRHLCAAAAAARSIIEASSLPLTPVSYFAAIITSLGNSNSLDAYAIGALTSLISIVLPLVARDKVKPEKAEEAVEVLVRTVEKCGVKLGTSGVRAAVKTVGVLVAEFCNLDKWDSVSPGFDWLVKLSLDRRPKVRKCAQDCLLTMFKSFQSSTLFKRASKSVYSLINDHMPAVSKVIDSKIVGGSEGMLPENQDIVHLLNLMKHVVPFLSPKFQMRMLPRLSKMLSYKIVVVTAHVFDVMLAILKVSGADVILSNAEEIFRSLVSYMSSDDSVDNVLFAATLSKTVLAKLHDGDMNEWTTYFPMVTEPLAGLLYSDAEVALRTSSILRELIDHHFDEKMLLRIECKLEDKPSQDADFKVIQATCNTFYNVLIVSSQLPSESVLAVIACLFRKLGRMSAIFMELIVLKLAESMNITEDASKTTHLQECFGCAIFAMGPEKLLSLLPITFSIKDLSISNVWLIPILEKNVAGSSLRFFLEHIVPVAKSFQKGSRKVKDSVIGKGLQAYSQGLWGLFPAFCHMPIDTYDSFGNLAKLLIPFIQKDSFMLEKIAIGLQVLVHENKFSLQYDQGSMESTEVKIPETLNEFPMNLELKRVYSRKTAKKNIKALALNSEEFLRALTDVFFDCVPETRNFLKGAIECLVSICDALAAKRIFAISADKFQLGDDFREHGRAGFDTKISVNDEGGGQKLFGEDTKRFMMLEFASCFVEGSDEDLMDVLFSVVKFCLQVNDEMSRIKTYQTLNRMLEAHSSFCCSKFDAVMDLLTEVKSSENIRLLQYRFSCLHTLLIYALKGNIDEENTKAFFILNEIIITLKDSDEEGRKAAYNALHGISCKLRSSSDSSYAGLYEKFVSLISSYLSGSSPHIKSGVVSAISVLVYNDPGLCITMPEVFHSVMELLHSKAIEVIKAVLGFVKVLVSSLQSNDLQRFLFDILDGVLRWSSVSRHHFRSKIIVILEIIVRKCGKGAVKAATPEKFKDFVQGVIENRHGKKSLSSNESAESNDSIPNQSEPPLKGPHKRKRGNDANSPRSEHRKRKLPRNKVDRATDSERAQKKQSTVGRRNDMKGSGGRRKHDEKNVMKKYKRS